MTRPLEVGLGRREEGYWFLDGQHGCRRRGAREVGRVVEAGMAEDVADGGRGTARTSKRTMLTG